MRRNYCALKTLKSSFNGDRQNKKMTLSVEVHSSTMAGDINLELLVEYTDGKPRKTLSQIVHIPANAWTERSVTLDFSDVDLSNVNYLAYHLVLGSIATDGNTILIRRPKLEFGSVVTPFIPDDPETNLAKCQRYFQTSYPLGIAPGTSTSPGNSAVGIAFNTSATGWFQNFIFGRTVFPVTMRTNPTFTAYNPDTGKVNSAAQLHHGGEFALTAGAAIGGNQSGLSMDVNFNTGGAAKTLVLHYTASAEL
ncbi:hypothetical protein [Endozoicomonas sp. SCSIO W0465]|uniref:hypothetical protein n=1 Tax=Endozoicomonas sp. SCSIO W0465 TaxID=2918516 RepID=UPI002076104C|nr:hypothetical protein [Endozoicomonas sp. SCSIO W0465]USE39250.1 hypothetical protein MJO57_14455 [Endozoicomonas sp. SCSIO W0465]